MAILCALLLIVCFFDYRQRRIPNWLLLPMLINGLIYRAYNGGPRGIGLFVVQLAAVMALLWFLYQIGGLGAGDVKLLCVISGYLPYDKIFQFLFVSMLISALISLIKLFHKRQVVPCGGNILRPKALTICMSGPIFLSLLLYLGGIY